MASNQLRPRSKSLTFYKDCFLFKPFYPKICIFWIYIYHNSGSIYYFFLFYKGNCSDFKLEIYVKRVFNLLIFVDGVSSSWWPPKPSHQGVNSWWPPKPLHQGDWFIMLTTQTITPRGSILHDANSRLSSQGDIWCDTRCHCCLHYNFLIYICHNSGRTSYLFYFISFHFIKTAVVISNFRFI